MGSISAGSDSPCVGKALSHRLSLFAGWLPYQYNPATAGTEVRNLLFGIGALDTALSTLTIPAAAKAIIVNARPVLRRPCRVVRRISTSAAQAGRLAE